MSDAMSDVSGWASSSLLYDFIVNDETSDARLVRSFERIRIVCNEISEEAIAMAKRGAQFSRNPIYLSEVGRRCRAKFGGPSAESIIRNRATEPYKAAYIELRARELELPGQNRPRDEDASCIEDVRLRTYVQSLEQRLKVSEEMIIGLTESLRNMRPISLDLAISAAGEDDTLEVAKGVRPDPNRTETAALARRLTDPGHLAQFGLKFEGGVFNPATGAELLSERDIAVLRALAAGP